MCVCVCVCVCILFWIIFHYRLLQDIEYSSMCYTVSTCLYLSIYICMHVYFNPQLLIYPSSPFPFGNHKFVFCVSLLCVVAQSCLTLWDRTHCTLPGSSVHEDSPDKNTGVGCHVLLQGIFSTQGSNPSLLHCRWILYHLSQEGNLYESVAIL